MTKFYIEFDSCLSFADLVRAKDQGSEGARTLVYAIGREVGLDAAARDQCYQRKREKALASQTKQRVQGRRPQTTASLSRPLAPRVGEPLLDQSSSSMVPIIQRDRCTRSLMEGLSFGRDDIPGGLVYVESTTLLKQCCQQVLKLWELNLLSVGQVFCLLQYWLYQRVISDAASVFNYSGSRRQAIDCNHRFLLQTFQAVAPFAPDFYDIVDFRLEPDVAFEQQAFNLIWLHRGEHLQYVVDLLSLICGCLNQSSVIWLGALLQFTSRPFKTEKCSFYTFIDEWIVRRLQAIEEHPEGSERDAMTHEVEHLQHLRHLQSVKQQEVESQRHKRLVQAQLQQRDPIFCEALSRALEEAEMNKRCMMVIDHDRPLSSSGKDISAEQQLRDAKTSFLHDFRKLDRIIRKRQMQKRNNQQNKGKNDDNVMACYEEKEKARRNYQRIKAIATAPEEFPSQDKYSPRQVAQQWLHVTGMSFSKMTNFVAEHIMMPNGVQSRGLKRYMRKKGNERSAEEAFDSDASRYRRERLLAKSRKRKYVDGEVHLQQRKRAHKLYSDENSNETNLLLSDTTLAEFE